MKSPIDEQFLTKLGAKFKFQEKFPIAKIDLKASTENPARIYRKLNKDVAETYGAMMLCGDDFPAIVLLNHEHPHDGMDWIVATGVHRLDGARQASIDTFDAILVTEPDQYRREVIIRMLNITVGHGMDMAEIHAHLLWLNEHHGTALSTLAKEWGVKPQSLINAANEQKARLRARRIGVDFDRCKVPSGTIIALGSIHSDPVFGSAVDFVCTFPGIRGDEVKEMAGQIRKERDEASQLAVVQKHRELAEKRIEMNKATKAKQKPTKITRAIRSMKVLNNQLDCPLHELHIASYEDRNGILLIIESLTDHLKLLRAEVERVERMSKPPQPELRRNGQRPDMQQPEARP
jgi:hypothetical protein